MMDDQYRSLLESLHNTLQSNREKTIEVDDVKLNTAVASQAREQDEEYNNRNELYTQLLNTYIKNYIDKEKVKSTYKLIFFIVTIALFVGIIVCGLISIIAMSVCGDGSLANVGIAIANIAGIVSTLMVLPRIIAEHLFPANEESNMLEMVKNMQDNDANIRNTLYKDKNEGK